MDFNSAIRELTQIVKSGKPEPLIFYRDTGGDWHCDHTQNQFGEVFEWVEGAKAQDPLALELTGKEFSKAGFPDTYGYVLSKRVNKEYRLAKDTGKGSDNIYALAKFFENHASSFSDRVTEYLADIGRPLNALQEMCPFRLTTDFAGHSYNESLALETIDCIEKSVRERLHCYPDEPIIKKRNIEGYEEQHSLQIAGRVVILAENKKADKPYMVCCCNSDNPLGLVEYTHVIKTGDYVEAMAEYAVHIQGFVSGLEDERSGFSNPAQTLTAADCIPGSMNKSLKDKIIIIKPEALAPEYRRSEHQLQACLGGFGASPGSRGNAVYCKELYTGKESRFEKSDVAGVAIPDNLPAWAMEKVKLLESIKEPGVFEYGGYHFKPHRQFRKGEVTRQTKGDTRIGKTDAAYAMRNMSSDRGLGLSQYDWKRDGTDYSHKGFYAASGNSDVDIFMCLENGKLYVPHEKELFHYKEPQQKKKPEMKPSLLGRLDMAVAEAREHNAARQDAAKPRKYGIVEVE